jgi:hypothetical protein
LRLSGVFCPPEVAGGHHEPTDDPDSAKKTLRKPFEAVLQASRLADSERRAHQQREVEPGYVNQQPFQYVASASKVRAAHPACVVAVRERPFHQLPTLPQQRLAPWAANPTPVAIHRVTLGREI